jgi:hypothetical protein
LPSIALCMSGWVPRGKQSLLSSISYLKDDVRPSWYQRSKCYLQERTILDREDTIGQRHPKKIAKGQFWKEISNFNGFRPNHCPQTGRNLATTRATAMCQCVLQNVIELLHWLIFILNKMSTNYSWFVYIKKNLEGLGVIYLTKWRGVGNTHKLVVSQIWNSTTIAALTCRPVYSTYTEKGLTCDPWNI